MCRFSQTEHAESVLALFCGRAGSDRVCRKCAGLVTQSMQKVCRLHTVGRLGQTRYAKSVLALCCGQAESEHAESVHARYGHLWLASSIWLQTYAASHMVVSTLVHTSCHHLDRGLLTLPGNTV